MDNLEELFAESKKIKNIFDGIDDVRADVSKLKKETNYINEEAKDKIAEAINSTMEYVRKSELMEAKIEIEGLKLYVDEIKYREHEEFKDIMKEVLLLRDPLSEAKEKKIDISGEIELISIVRGNLRNNNLEAARDNVNIIKNCLTERGLYKGEDS